MEKKLGEQRDIQLVLFTCLCVGNMQKYPEFLNILHSTFILEICLGRTPGIQVPRSTLNLGKSPPSGLFVILT